MLSDDPASEPDMRSWARNTGHDLLGSPGADRVPLRGPEDAVATVAPGGEPERAHLDYAGFAPVDPRSSR
jgi:hypothetical protein